jgi:hypothetical protein
VEVRHINRSSFTTYHPKVYTGAKSEYKIKAQAEAIGRGVQQPYSNAVAPMHRNDAHLRRSSI